MVVSYTSAYVSCALGDSTDIDNLIEEARKRRFRGCSVGSGGGEWAGGEVPISKHASQKISPSFQPDLPNFLELYLEQLHSR